MVARYRFQTDGRAGFVPYAGYQAFREVQGRVPVDGNGPVPLSDQPLTLASRRRPQTRRSCTVPANWDGWTRRWSAAPARWGSSPTYVYINSSMIEFLTEVFESLEYACSRRA